jgi:hypothetical protein
MQPSIPDRGRRDTAAPEDLPYGPLPVRPPVPGPPRRFASGARADSPHLDSLVDLSWLEREPPLPEDDAIDDPDPPAGEAESEAAVGLSLATPRPETDDDVHFGVAARALGVSRKTVERMVKRGQLERGPSNAPATVSKRALVAVLEARRRDVSHLTRATEIEQARSGSDWLSEDPSGDPASALRDLLAPVLAPLLDEFIAARTRAAVLENQLENIAARADQQRARDELLLALATKGWWGRRKTRKAVLRHYVLGEEPADEDSRSE